MKISNKVQWTSDDEDDEAFSDDRSWVMAQERDKERNNK